jgi:phosphate transport system protein
MTQLETEIMLLKNEVKNLWALVNSQLVKARTALLHFDKDLAREVILKEKRVNGSELKIDRDCENMFALYTPVAIDLRFLLAVLKINSNLERIGDIAEGIAKYVLSSQEQMSAELIEATKLADMYNEAMIMLEDTQNAFEREDTALARGVFKKDEVLDIINKNANHAIMGYLETYPKDIDAALYALSIIRKLERVGDQAKNIGEEIIFYLEAKVLKHSGKS